MNAWKRLKRLWELSAQEEEQTEGFKWTAWTKPVNQPDSAMIIPFQKVSPVEKIVNEQS